MTRHRSLGWLLLAVAAVACEDVISAPAVCPEFCPAGTIEVRDTLLSDNVEAIGSYTGYRLPPEATQLQVVGPGGPAESRALLLFNPFSVTFSGADTTVKDSILQTDSLEFRFNVIRRNQSATGVVLALHEIPGTVDSSTTFADMAPYFEDSTLITTVTLPDTLLEGQVTATVPSSALRHFAPDTVQSGIGIRISSAEPAFVTIGPADTILAGRATRFVQLDSASGASRVTRTDSRVLAFRTFVADVAGFPASAGLDVGGVNAARAFIKLNVPASLVDSTLVVRATLLVPAPRPTFGAPGDTFRVRVHALGADFGPKSPLLAQEADTAAANSALVPAGSSDTVAIDITKILVAWRNNTAQPRTIMLRVVPEAGSINTFELPDANSPLRVALRMTYGLPFRLVGR